MFHNHSTSIKQDFVRQLTQKENTKKLFENWNFSYFEWALSLCIIIDTYKRYAQRYKKNWWRRKPKKQRRGGNLQSEISCWYQQTQRRSHHGIIAWRSQSCPSRKNHVKRSLLVIVSLLGVLQFIPSGTAQTALREASNSKIKQKKVSSLDWPIWTKIRLQHKFWWRQWKPIGQTKTKKAK